MAISVQFYTSFLPVWAGSPRITNLYSPSSLLVKMVHGLCPFVKRKVMELADFVPLSSIIPIQPALSLLPHTQISLTYAVVVTEAGAAAATTCVWYTIKERECG